nr:transposase [Amycolatopsis lurida]
MPGLPDAIRGVFPNTVVQTCVVHVIRKRDAVRLLR